MSKRILLVEDESSIADNIVYSLESDGCAVSWVSVGQEGIGFCKQNRKLQEERRRDRGQLIAFSMPY